MDATSPPPAEQPPFPPPAPQPPYGQAPPNPAPPNPAPPNKTDGFFDAMRRIGVVRTQNRWIGGVAGGIAQRFGIDPLLVRGILGVTVLFGGAGLIIYGLGWALLPEQADGRIHLQETIRGRFDVALTGAIAMFVIGINQGSGWFGFWNNHGLAWLNGLLWLAAIVTLIALVAAGGNQRRAGARYTGPGAPGPNYPGPGYPGPGAPGPSYPGTNYPGPRYPGPSYTGPSYTGPGSTGPSYTGPSYTGPGSTGPSYTGQAPAGPQGYPTAPVPPAPASGYYTPPPTGYYTPPPVPPVPPRPVKPYVRGPGAGAVGAVVGLTLLAAALLLVLRRQGDLDWPVSLTAGGIGIVLAGLGILLAGLRGRSSGTLGFLAIVGILVAVPASAIVSSTWVESANNLRIIATDNAWVPTTTAQASEGVSVGVGDVKVDLTQLPLGHGTVRVPIALGVGDLTVTVPPGTAVSAEVSLSAGDIGWEIDQPQQISGVSGKHHYSFASTEITDGASPELVLEIETGAVQVRVVEGN